MLKDEFYTVLNELRTAVINRFGKQLTISYPNNFSLMEASQFNVWKNLSNGVAYSTRPQVSDLTANVDKILEDNLNVLKQLRDDVKNGLGCNCSTVCQGSCSSRCSGCGGCDGCDGCGGCTSCKTAMCHCFTECHGCSGHCDGCSTCKGCSGNCVGCNNTCSNTCKNGCDTTCSTTARKGVCVKL